MGTRQSVCFPSFGNMDNGGEVVSPSAPGTQFSEIPSDQSEGKNDMDVDDDDSEDDTTPPGGPQSDFYRFFTVSVSQLSSGQSLALAKGKSLLETCRSRCETEDFKTFVHKWGISGASFEPNPHCKDGNVVYDRFLASLRKIPKVANISIVFHGTSEANIPNILENGLDPAKRNGQSYGPGEYFSTDPVISVGYCKYGGKRMLVFIVVEPFGKDLNKSKVHCPPEYVVVPTNEHQLPLGVLSFASTSQEAIRRSSNAKSKLHNLNEEFRKAKERADIAKIKATVIQKIISGGIDVASEYYKKHKDLLSFEDKKEISMFAHRSNDAEFIEFYFEDLPSPMTSEEHDTAAIDNVDCLDRDVETAKNKLDQMTKEAMVLQIRNDS